MNLYILISIAVLMVIVLLLFIVGKGRKTAKLTPLAGLAFAFVLAGVFFGQNRIVGYGLLGIGVILAVIDIVMGLRRS
jgi:hypothetical protein